jgi:SOS response regulatory protein OraA/RecX
MSELLGKFSGGELIGLTAVVGGMLVAVILGAFHQWRRVRMAEISAALKQQMLDKGMSADEIDKVIRAKPAGGEAAAEPADAASLNKAGLAARMADQGYEAGDIERIVRAIQEPPRGTDSTYPAPLGRDKALVARKMIDQGYEAEDIERVLRAYEDTDSRPARSDAFKGLA